MNGGLSQFVRAAKALPADAPLADRWHQLGEDIAAHGRELERAQAEHRANMIARYGLADDHFERCPANPTLTYFDPI